MKATTASVSYNMLNSDLIPQHFLVSQLLKLAKDAANVVIGPIDITFTVQECVCIKWRMYISGYC